MAVLSKEIKNFDYIYKIDYGWFLIDKALGSYNCRDVFLNCWIKLKKDPFYYRLQPFQKSQEIIDSITYIEDKVKLHEDLRAVIYPTTNAGVVFCNPGKWWASIVRLSLLTMVLRFPNFEGKYFDKTSKEAFNHFLEGNVYYHGSIFKGWCSQFNTANSFTLLKKTPIEDKNLKVHLHYTFDVQNIINEEI